MYDYPNQLVDFTNLNSDDTLFHINQWGNSVDNKIKGIESYLDYLTSPIDIKTFEISPTQYSKNKTLYEQVLSYPRGTTLTEDIISDLLNNDITEVKVSYFQINKGEFTYVTKLLNECKLHIDSWASILNPIEDVISLLSSTDIFKLNNSNIDLFLEEMSQYGSLAFPEEYFELEPIYHNDFSGKPAISDGFAGFSPNPHTSYKSLVNTVLSYVESVWYSTTTSTSGVTTSGPTAAYDDWLSNSYQLINFINNLLDKINILLNNIANNPEIYHGWDSIINTLKSKTETLKSELETARSTLNANSSYSQRSTLIAALNDILNLSYADTSLYNQLPNLETYYSSRWFWIIHLLHRAFGLYGNYKSMSDMVTNEQRKLQHYQCLSGYIKSLT